MKILAGAGHPGGANAILPVIKKLKENNEQVSLIKSTDVVEKVYSENKLTSEDKSFEELDAEVILTASATEKNTIDQKLIRYGSEKNIPVVSVLDMWVHYKERYSDEKGNLAYLPTKIAVMDELALHAMIKEGFPKEVLTITGQPAFDDLGVLASNFTEEKKLTVRRALDSNQKLVQYFCHADKGLPKEEYGFSDEDNMNLLAEALTSLPVTLVINPPPRELKEKPEKFENFKNKFKEKGVSALLQRPDLNALEVCLASDLVVGVYSTMLVNSAYMNINTLSLSPNNKKGNGILITRELEVTPYANNFEEGVNLVKKVLTDLNYQRELVQRRKTFTTDGKATERVTNLVYNLALRTR